MKSIFWTQNADVNEENSVYIDGKPSKDYSMSDVDVAFRRISQYQLDDDFAYIDFQSAYSGDSRSPIPMISVHSVGYLLYRRQS